MVHLDALYLMLATETINTTTGTTMQKIRSLGTLSDATLQSFLQCAAELFVLTMFGFEQQASPDAQFANANKVFKVLVRLTADSPLVTVKTALAKVATNTGVSQDSSDFVDLAIWILAGSPKPVNSALVNPASVPAMPASSVDSALVNPGSLSANGSIPVTNGANTGVLSMLAAAGPPAMSVLRASGSALAAASPPARQAGHSLLDSVALTAGALAGKVYNAISGIGVPATNGRSENGWEAEPSGAPSGPPATDHSGISRSESGLRNDGRTPDRRTTIGRGLAASISSNNGWVAEPSSQHQAKSRSESGLRNDSVTPDMRTTMGRVLAASRSPTSSVAGSPPSSPSRSSSERARSGKRIDGNWDMRTTAGRNGSAADALARSQ